MEWAENGEVCVDKFRNSAPGFFDAILMDIHMPVMDGHLPKPLDLNELVSVLQRFLAEKD